MIKKYASGKVNYYIDGKSFENSPKKRDGKDKAIQYCLDNFLNVNDIIKFDSRTERDRYIYLKELQDKGEISNLTHHYLLKVQNPFKNACGDEVEEITYNADFIYYDIKNKRRVIEDVKGTEFFIDERFILLKKIFDYVYLNKKLYISVILKDKNAGWYEYHFGQKKKKQKRLKAQSEKIKDLQKQLHDKDKREKLKIRYEELKNKPKLTKKEQERLNNLKNIFENA